MLLSRAFYHFSPTCLINSINHEHSCKILYLSDPGICLYIIVVSIHALYFRKILFKLKENIKLIKKQALDQKCAVLQEHFIFYKKNRKLEDLTVLKRSPDLLNNVKIGQDQLGLIMKHILIYGGCSHFGQVTKQSNEYSIKQHSDF